MSVPEAFSLKISQLWICFYELVADKIFGIERVDGLLHISFDLFHWFLSGPTKPIKESTTILVKQVNAPKPSNFPPGFCWAMWACVVVNSPAASARHCLSFLWLPPPEKYMEMRKLKRETQGHKTDSHLILSTLSHPQSSPLLELVRQFFKSIQIHFRPSMELPIQVLRSFLRAQIWHFRQS